MFRNKQLAEYRATLVQKKVKIILKAKEREN